MKGPPPKDPSRRARRNVDPVPTTVVAFRPAEQPNLPDAMPGGGRWPVRTREWWAQWGESPLAGEFCAVDWSELLDTAVIHGAFWTGDLRQAAELRRRVARFGVTPEDRARLRIRFGEPAPEPAADRAGDKWRAERRQRLIDGP